MSFWVHRHLDSEVWTDATEFDPHLPKAIPTKGYPKLVVNALGIELEYASFNEAEHFLEVISKKNMQTSTQLSKLRGSSTGPNSHWLSRLPSKLKPWSKREKIIPVIKEAIHEFKSIYK